MTCASSRPGGECHKLLSVGTTEVNWLGGVGVPTGRVRLHGGGRGPTL